MSTVLPELHLSADTRLDDLLMQADAARQSGDLQGGQALMRELAPLLAAAQLPQRQRARFLHLHFLYRTGALQQVIDEAREALPGLRQGAGTYAFEILRMLVIAACDTGNFNLALTSAQECHQLAMAGDDKGRHAQALNVMACCFERMGDPWQGERLMGEALAIARAHGSPHDLFVTLNNLAALLIGRYYLLRDAVSEVEARVPLETALPHVEEAHARARGMSDPFPGVFAEGNLGEVLLHLGRHAEAGEHLNRALERAQRLGYLAQDWRIKCSIGELQLAVGQPAQAWDTLSDALARSAGNDPRLTQMRLHHALSHAARAIGRPAAALDHLEAYLRIERERSVQQLHAQSQLFITRVEAEQVRQEVQRQRLRAAELEVDARRDQLTGVGNRREVEHRLPAMLATAQRDGTPLVLIMLDIDHFKQVNDRFGHGAGDAVLVALGQLLREATRAHDLVARLGGEEFLLVLWQTDTRQAQEVCERLRQRIAVYGWDAVAPSLRVTVSMGLASTPPYDEHGLVASADQALYRAKSEGRDRVVSA